MIFSKIDILPYNVLFCLIYETICSFCVFRIKYQLQKFLLFISECFFQATPSEPEELFGQTGYGLQDFMVAHVLCRISEFIKSHIGLSNKCDNSFP